MKKITTLLFLSITLLSLRAQVIRLQENFNLGTLPLNWITSAVTGSQTWSLGVDGSISQSGNNNLDGTSMAYFDDNNLGAANTNNQAFLTSPVFDNSMDLVSFLEFDYNFRQFGATVQDKFYVEIFDGVNWITVFTTNTNDCGNWLGSCSGNFPHAKIDISAFTNVNCQIRFAYDDGNDWAWYVGVDNVLITANLNNDLSITEIRKPISSCNLTTVEQIQVIIKNKGANVINVPFDVGIFVNNGSQSVSETVISTINIGDSVIYTFSSGVNLSSKGIYSLKAYTSFNLDSNNTNDTLIRSVENSTPFTIPYFEDFEGVSSNWNGYGQNSSWSVGAPSSTFLNTTFQGLSSLVTNPSGFYNNSEISYFETPCIVSNQTNKTPIVSFYINYRSEVYFDGLILESSVDNGVTWQKVNTGSKSSNWYSKNSMWSGNSNGWVKFENYLDSTLIQSDFKMRFKMVSDVGGIQDGFAIDDFQIYYQTPVSIVENNINPKFSIYPNPNNGTFNLNVSNKLIGKQYQVFDIKGSLIKQASINVPISQIELSNIEKGVYFIQIDGYTKTEKVVVF